MRDVSLRFAVAFVLFTGTAALATAEEPAKGEKPKHTNRLSKETSPYLLLHAHNPVDWYPWGEEAWAKAKKENKLVFLSIGYSSCHWCHVMERESFMDEEIAKYLNENFICIKVDREERPDIDEIYMAALQLYMQLIGSNRGGGWPLSMFLTPEGKPIGGGTYFPPRPKNGMDGFLNVCQKIAGLWKDQPDAIEKGADYLTTLVKQGLEGRPNLVVELPGAEVIDAVRTELSDTFDPEYGGFSYSEEQPQRPKFPEPGNLLFLLRDVERRDKERSRKMLLGTLDGMAAGGIRDQVGGGFHRYSTDRFWLIPHFEKMLYDNGQLASVYAQAYALTGNEAYRRVVEELMTFVEREMRHEQGGFYSALDADAGGHEGAYYAWSKEELQKVLGQEDYDLIVAAYGVLLEPNFEGTYVLHLVDTPAELARQQKLELAEWYERVAAANAKLWKHRQSRTAPPVDTKILTAWNGLMISGAADAGRLLKQPKYVQMAEQAANFVLENMRDNQGRLLHSYAGDDARLTAYLDDYTHFVAGLIALHRATGQQKWLDAAGALTEIQLADYLDKEAGGFYYTSSDHEELLVRTRGPVDGAEPSGNSVAVENLVYLGQQLNRPEYLKHAERTVKCYAPILQRAPEVLPRLVLALEDLLDAQQQAPAPPK